MPFACVPQDGDVEMGLDAKALSAAQAAADARAAAAREDAELLRLALGMYALPHCHVMHEADPDIKARALAYPQT